MKFFGKENHQPNEEELQTGFKAVFSKKLKEMFRPYRADLPPVLTTISSEVTIIPEETDFWAICALLLILTSLFEVLREDKKSYENKTQLLGGLIKVLLTLKLSREFSDAILSELGQAALDWIDANTWEAKEPIISFIGGAITLVNRIAADVGPEIREFQMSVIETIGIYPFLSVAIVGLITAIAVKISNEKYKKEKATEIAQKRLTEIQEILAELGIDIEDGISTKEALIAEEAELHLLLGITKETD